MVEHLSGRFKGQSLSSHIIRYLFKNQQAPHTLSFHAYFFERLLPSAVCSSVGSFIVHLSHHTHAQWMPLGLTCFTFYPRHFICTVLFICYWINALEEPKISTNWSNRQSRTLSNMLCWGSDPELSVGKQALGHQAVSPVSSLNITENSQNPFLIEKFSPPDRCQSSYLTNQLWYTQPVLTLEEGLIWSLLIHHSELKISSSSDILVMLITKDQQQVLLETRFTICCCCRSPYLNY